MSSTRPFAQVGGAPLAKELRGVADLLEGLSEAQVQSDDLTARVLESMMRAAWRSKVEALREAALRLESTF